MLELDVLAGNAVVLEVGDEAGTKLIEALRGAVHTLQAALDVGLWYGGRGGLCSQGAGWQRLRMQRDCHVICSYLHVPVLEAVEQSKSEVRHPDACGRAWMRQMG